MGQSAEVSQVDKESLEHVPVAVLAVDDVSVGDAFVVGLGAGAWRVFLPLPSIFDPDPARRRAKRSCFGFMIRSRLMRGGRWRLNERLPINENMVLRRIVSSGEDEENEVNVYGLAYVVFMVFGAS